MGLIIAEQVDLPGGAVLRMMVCDHTSTPCAYDKIFF
jgi:hypothetical protein